MKSIILVSFLLSIPAMAQVKGGPSNPDIISGKNGEGTRGGRENPALQQLNDLFTEIKYELRNLSAEVIGPQGKQFTAAEQCQAMNQILVDMIDNNDWSALQQLVTSNERFYQAFQVESVKRGLELFWLNNSISEKELKNFLGNFWMTYFEQLKSAVGPAKAKTFYQMINWKKMGLRPQIKF